MRMLWLVLAVGVGSCGPQPEPAPPVPPAKDEPAPHADPTSVAVAIAHAVEVRQQVAHKTLDTPNLSTDFLINVVSLTHKLDVAVAVLKLHPTAANRDKLKVAVHDLQQLTE